MKQVFYVMLVLLLTGPLNLNSQVTIGSLESPHEAAVLDLHSNDNMGLLLPRLKMAVDETQWNLNSSPVEGMLVFNTDENTLSGKGIYSWYDGKWNYLCA